MRRDGLPASCRTDLASANETRAMTYVDGNGNRRSNEPAVEPKIEEQSFGRPILVPKSQAAVCAPATSNIAADIPTSPAFSPDEAFADRLC